MSEAVLLGETEDSLACVPSAAKSSLPLLLPLLLLLLLLAKSPDLRLYPQGLKKYPGPYQAGPSHGLECKHTVAQGLLFGFCRIRC